jgi:hypothetical protein
MADLVEGRRRGNIVKVEQKSTHIHITEHKNTQPQDETAADPAATLSLLHASIKWDPTIVWSWEGQEGWGLLYTYNPGFWGVRIP